MSRLLSIGEACRADGCRARHVGRGLAVYINPATGEMEVGRAEPLAGDERTTFPVSDAKVAAAHGFLTGELAPTTGGAP